MKRITNFTLLLIILVVFITCEQAGDPAGDFAFQTLPGGKTVEIVDHIGNIPAVHIPDKLHKKQVVSIGERAFANKGISSIIIPRSVKKIGEYAFEGNELKRIVLGPRVDIPKTGWVGNFYDYYDGLYGRKAGLYIYEPLKSKEEYLNVYFVAGAMWASFTSRHLRRIYNEPDMTKQEFFKMMKMDKPLIRENYKWILSEEEWIAFRDQQAAEIKRIIALTPAEWAQEKRDLKNEIDRGWENYQKNPEPIWHYLR